MRNLLEHYMATAITEAKKAGEAGETPIGAIIVKEGQIIAKAHNCKERFKSPIAHAEILVIEKAAKFVGDWRLSDCSIFVTAEPCPMCMGAIMQSRIKKLVYGCFEPRYGAVETSVFLKNHPMLPKDMEIIGGICEDECEKLLKYFFKYKR